MLDLFHVYCVFAINNQAHLRLNIRYMITDRNRKDYYIIVQTLHSRHVYKFNIVNKHIYAILKCGRRPQSKKKIEIFLAIVYNANTHKCALYITTTTHQQ